MRLFGSLFSLLFDHPVARRAASRPARRSAQPVPAPSRPTPPPVPHVSAEVELEISKAARQLQFLDRAYHLELWSGEAELHNWQHDLGLMRASGDLAYVALELLDAAGQICGQFRIDFQPLGQRTAFAKVDSGGIELPLLDRSRVVGRRMIVRRNGHPECYAAHLRLSWGPAPTLTHTGGDSYASEHAARISGGRESATFFVGSSARHDLVITNASPTGQYCFARSHQLGVDNVFVMRRHAPGLPFAVGTRFTAVIAQTPKGLQARAARST